MNIIPPDPGGRKDAAKRSTEIFLQFHLCAQPVDFMMEHKFSDTRRNQ
jgi:hypothetical protein